MDRWHTTGLLRRGAGTGRDGAGETVRPAACTPPGDLMSHDQHTVLRSMHDLGLATWFGGNLMGAVGLNRAASAAKDPGERTRLDSIGWSAWWPVQGAAIAAHLVGSVGMLRAD